MAGVLWDNMWKPHLDMQRPDSYLPCQGQWESFYTLAVMYFPPRRADLFIYEYRHKLYQALSTAISIDYVYLILQYIVILILKVIWEESITIQEIVSEATEASVSHYTTWKKIYSGNTNRNISSSFGLANGLETIQEGTCEQGCPFPAPE